MKNQKGDLSGIATSVVAVFVALAFGVFFIAMLYSKLNLSADNPFAPVFNQIPTDFAAAIGIVVLLITVVLLMYAWRTFTGGNAGGRGE
ncbi:hypothetical protein [Methanocella sp. MCL-LM]|uniref:hypothetical protein n=1 Tax=Methanocella sp. MCL-LM TaxID=3412035 RepID=UPI003C71F83D